MAPTVKSARRASSSRTPFDPTSMASLVKNVVHWGSNSKSPTIPPADMCEFCGRKPKYVERGFKHPYCSRSCARDDTGSNPQACTLRGCRSTGKPAFYNFCSERHAKQGVQLGEIPGCVSCNKLPQRSGTTELCIPCERLLKAGPLIREVTDRRRFKRVRDEFESEWDVPDRFAVLEKVYEIVMPVDVGKRKRQYRSTIGTPRDVKSFYSSECVCDLGVHGPQLCSLDSCGICNAAKSSFSFFAFKESFNFGRYGEGVYSYKNPGLADRFATSCTSSPYRVMLACDVVLEPDIQIPDTESIFVSTANAISPVYILMYKVST